MRENCFAGNPPTVPPLQRAFQDLVLTDQDAESLRAVAVDYERKSAAFLTVAGPLSSEARFQSIDSGSVSEELVARIRNLDSEQDQMVSDEIKRLKEALGSERFEVLRKTVMAEKPEVSRREDRRDQLIRRSILTAKWRSEAGLQQLEERFDEKFTRQTNAASQPSSQHDHRSRR